MIFVLFPLSMAATHTLVLTLTKFIKHVWNLTNDYPPPSANSSGWLRRFNISFTWICQKLSLESSSSINLCHLIKLWANFLHSYIFFPPKLLIWFFFFSCIMLFVSSYYIIWHRFIYFPPFLHLWKEAFISIKDSFICSNPKGEVSPLCLMPGMTG